MPRLTLRLLATVVTRVLPVAISAINRVGSSGRRGQIKIAPRAYSFSMSGHGNGGSPPAGLALRLDTSAAPEPACRAFAAVTYASVGSAVCRSAPRSVRAVGLVG